MPTFMNHGDSEAGAQEVASAIFAPRVTISARLDSGRREDCLSTDKCSDRKDEAISLDSDRFRKDRVFILLVQAGLVEHLAPDRCPIVRQLQPWLRVGLRLESQGGFSSTGPAPLACRGETPTVPR